MKYHRSEDERRRGAVSAGIWASRRGLASPYDKAVIGQNVFRPNGHAFKIGTAAQIYRSLSTTPFVSLYATASINEDLAELVTYHELYDRFHESLRIEVRDGSGRLVYQYEPSQSPVIQARFAMVDSLLKAAG